VYYSRNKRDYFTKQHYVAPVVVETKFLVWERNRALVLRRIPWSKVTKCTYLLTPWSRVLLEKLSGSQLIKKFSAFYGIRVHYRIHKCPPHFLTLSQLDPVHTPTFYFLKIRLNIILPSIPGSSQWSRSLRFTYQIPVCASSPPYVLHVYPILLDFITRTIFDEE